MPRSALRKLNIPRGFPGFANCRSSHYTFKVAIHSVTTAESSPPANGVWGTIRSYILWQHERGTLHYDIMVTLILIFVFFSPAWINFNDKPVPRNAHPTGVTVTADGQGGLIYLIDASAITPDGKLPLPDQLLHIIEPISGEVSIVKYETTADRKGKVQS